MSHTIYELRHFGDFGGKPCTYVIYYEDRELAEKNLKRLALKYGEDALEIREEEVLGWDIYDDCDNARLGWSSGEFGDESRVCICDVFKTMVFVDDGSSLEEAREVLCKNCRSKGGS